MTGFALTPFVQAHLPELVDLWVAAWKKAMPNLDFEARRAWIVDKLGDIRDNGGVIICAFDVSNGEMAGFVTIEPKTAWLDQIAVAPAYQGSAAAQALLDAARARSGNELFLDVNEANGRARAFYAREGFVEIGKGINPASGLATVSLMWKPPRSDA